MEKSVYKSAMSNLRTNENFQEETYAKLMREMAKTTQDTNTNNQSKERINMVNTNVKKNKGTRWAIGVAACAAVLSVSIFAMNQGSTPSTTATPSQAPTHAIASKPPILGKVAVNIDGIITEVSADGQSFKVGDLWVDVTDATKLGSGEPTAAAPSAELLNREFSVGNIVSGYTSQDVSTGRVTADVLYTNLAPEKQAVKPATTGKAMVNIDGVISEVSADGKSFKVGDLWVTVTPDTMLGIDGPTAAAPSDELLQKEFKVGNVVSGFTSDDLGTGKVNATRIYNNFAPQQ